MRKAYTICSLLLMVAATAPALADTIYLPFVDSGVEGANRVTTKIWVSNPSGANRRFSTYFIPTGSDADEPRQNRPQTGVAPGALKVVDPGVPRTGVLEISGAPQLRYTARLEVRTPGGQLLSTTRLPFLGSDNMIEAGESVQVQGLERRPNGATTDFGVLSLSQEESQCTISFFRSNGTKIAPTVTIAQPALGLRYFEEVFGPRYLNQTSIADARFEVSCDAPFYAYALISNRSNGEVLFVNPATPGNSELFAPGDEPPVPAGTVVFERAGQFLNSTTSAARTAYNLPAVPGKAYSRMTIDFDFRFDRYHTPLFHTLTSLRGNGIYYVVTLRGDRNKTILETDAGGSAGEGGPWERGRTYHIRIILDANTRVGTLQVFQGNQLLQELSHPMVRRTLGRFGNQPLAIDFSQDKVYDNAFFPLWGSRFSNLKVVMEPAE